MGVQVEPLNKSSFEQYGPWHFQDSRFHQDQRVHLGAALLRVAALPVINDHRLSELSSKTVRGDDRILQQIPGDKATALKLTKPSTPLWNFSIQPSPSSSSSSSAEVSTLVPPTVSKIEQPVICPEFKPAFAISKFGSLAGNVVVSFPLKEVHVPPPPRPDLKRRRPDTDVDGVNTASLSCKKRRLLRYLITSRLSEPFSFPATHILNREGLASGDKRFLKLAAIMSARRLQLQGPYPPQPSPSSMLRRHALHNAYRLRMYAGGSEFGAVMGPRAASPLQQQHQQPTLGMPATMIGAGARFPPVSGPTAGPAMPVIAPTAAPRMPPMVGLQAPLPPPVSSPTTLLQPPPGPVQPRLRIPSPRLTPVRSPELRVTRPDLRLDDLDDLDDDGVAFPTSEHESRYEDEPEDVYADFGLIFGGSAEGDMSSDDEGEHFEDYMDDVDGIPWNARC
ncbi:hypothetical protein QBC43DRAFT_203073 [Cladorrhinum sp. PSN259]|nr:hypothetical protein QBC43DRAFT_203073 [Cladorrhinum sp. PSN259]